MPPKHKDTKLHQRTIENNRDNDFDPIPVELDEINPIWPAQPRCPSGWSFKIDGKSSWIFNKF